MPNYCDNDLWVDGPLEILRTFATRMESPIPNKSITAEVLDRLTLKPEPQENVFDFNQVLPYPDQYRIPDEVARQWEREHPGHICPNSDGYNAGGYEWCCEHWGTKWNASDAYREWPKNRHGQTRRLFYTFDTAWSPPIPVITTLGKLYPQLTFTLRYYERGVGFKGVYAVKGEKVLKREHGDYNGSRGG